MNIAIVINTCAGERTAVRSTANQVHEQRGYALEQFILPIWTARNVFTVVVGSWHEGVNYHYLPAGSIYHTAVDALHQRELAYQFCEENSPEFDWIVFQHDDHMLDPSDLWSALRWHELSGSQTDIVIPVRKCIKSGEVVDLNNGYPKYISGHCAIYRPNVLSKCQWREVPKIFTWDIEHTKQITAAGFTFEQDNQLIVRDVEMGATPWL